MMHHVTLKIGAGQHLGSSVCLQEVALEEVLKEITKDLAVLQ